jgi:hypothetical protein
MVKINKILEFIPENLDLEKHLEMFPPTEISYFKMDRLIRIISILYGDNVNEKYVKNGFICLSSKYLQKIVRQPSQYTKYLLRTCIIECDYKAYKGLKSFGYKISAKYREALPTATKKPVKSRIRTKYNYIDKWVIGLEIDAFGAWDEIKEYPLDKRNTELIKIVKIMTRTFYASVDKTSYRYHYNLTNIKSTVRKFIHWKGSQLVNIDISNSQPYFSTKILGLNPQTIIYTNLSTTINSYILQIQNRSSDVEKYVKLCVSGELYPFLQQKIEEFYNVNFTTRKEVKMMVFSVLFSDNRFVNDAKKIFRNHFPNVYAHFASIKKGDNSKLAVLLQSFESEAVLSIACKRIAEERPNVPILPIHDSITTTVGNEYYVGAILEEELEKYVGHKPTLTYEYFHDLVKNQDQKLNAYEYIYSSRKNEDQKYFYEY